MLKPGDLTLIALTLADGKPGTLRLTHEPHPDLVRFEIYAWPLIHMGLPSRPPPVVAGTMTLRAARSLSHTLEAAP